MGLPAPPCKPITLSSTTRQKFGFGRVSGFTEAGLLWPFRVLVTVNVWGLYCTRIRFRILRTAVAKLSGRLGGMRKNWPPVEADNCANRVVSAEGRPR